MLGNDSEQLETTTLFIALIAEVEVVELPLTEEDGQDIATHQNHSAENAERFLEAEFAFLLASILGYQPRIHTFTVHRKG